MTHEEIRRLSSTLFGNADRLMVAAAIGRLEGKPISAKVVASECGLDYNRVQGQVAHFKRAGVLIPNFDSDSRVKEYVPVLPNYWRSAARLLEELKDLEFVGWRIDS